MSTLCTSFKWFIQNTSTAISASKLQHVHSLSLSFSFSLSLSHAHTLTHTHINLFAFLAGRSWLQTAEKRTANSTVFVALTTWSRPSVQPAGMPFCNPPYLSLLVYNSRSSLHRRPIESRVIHALGKTWHPEVCDLDSDASLSPWFMISWYVLPFCSILCAPIVRSRLRDVDTMRRREKLTVRETIKR